MILSAKNYVLACETVPMGNKCSKNNQEGYNDRRILILTVLALIMCITDAYKLIIIKQAQFASNIRRSLLPS